MKRMLPRPECTLGYPYSQLERIFDKQELARLHLWMGNQTQAICEGRSYNHETKTYEVDECGRKGEMHGVVTYKWDIERWLMAGDIID